MWNPLSTKKEADTIREHIAANGPYAETSDVARKALNSYLRKKVIQTALATTVTVGAAYYFDKKFNKDN